MWRSLHAQFVDESNERRVLFVEELGTDVERAVADGDGLDLAPEPIRPLEEENLLVAHHVRGDEAGDAAADDHGVVDLCVVYGHGVYSSTVC